MTSPSLLGALGHVEFSLRTSDTDAGASSSKTRVSRTPDELQRELADQLELLMLACRLYDEGRQVTSKWIAVQLRLLLATWGKKNFSLLGQLGLLDVPFYDTIGAPLPPGTLVGLNTLVAIRIGGQGGYIPILDNSSRSAQIAFNDWWKRSVIFNQAGAGFSRDRIIREAADTDGGAHVDPELVDCYAELSRRPASLQGMSASHGDAYLFPERACLRQIAHEVLRTIERAAPESFRHPYAPLELTSQLGEVHISFVSMQIPPGT